MKLLNHRTLGIAVALSLVVLVTLFALPAASSAAPLPDTTLSVVAPASGNICTYVVQYADRLYKIAARFGTTTAYLASLNSLYNPNYIYTGMVLKVPCAQPQPLPQQYPQPVVYPQPQPGGICAYYIVQRGDWLKTIAARYGVSWQALAAANGLSNANYIYYGQRLVIPCPQYPVPQPQPQPQPVPCCIPPQPPPCCVPPVYPTPVPIYPTPVPYVATVEMKDNYYNPAVITVKQGQWVQWVNQGGSPHTVTQGLCPQGVCTPTPGGFGSGLLNPGQSYAFQFTQLGTFAYFCQVHGAAMTGSVAVVP